MFGNYTTWRLPHSATLGTQSVWHYPDVHHEWTEFLISKLTLTGTKTFFHWNWYKIRRAWPPKKFTFNWDMGNSSVSVWSGWFGVKDVSKSFGFSCIAASVSCWNHEFFLWSPAFWRSPILWSGEWTEILISKLTLTGTKTFFHWNWYKIRRAWPPKKFTFNWDMGNSSVSVWSGWFGVKDVSKSFGFSCIAASVSCWNHEFFLCVRSPAFWPSPVLWSGVSVSTLTRSLFRLYNKEERISSFLFERHVWFFRLPPPAIF